MGDVEWRLLGFSAKLDTIDGTDESQNPRSQWNGEVGGEQHSSSSDSAASVHNALVTTTGLGCTLSEFLLNRLCFFYSKPEREMFLHDRQF